MCSIVNSYTYYNLYCLLISLVHLVPCVFPMFSSQTLHVFFFHDAPNKRQLFLGASSIWQDLHGTCLGRILFMGMKVMFRWEKKIIVCDKLPLIWANYNNSLTWIVGPFGDDSPYYPWFPVRSQWGRYNLPRLIYYHIIILFTLNGNVYKWWFIYYG